MFSLAAILIGDVARSRVARRDSEGDVCVETSSLFLEFRVCLGICSLELVT